MRLPHLALSVMLASWALPACGDETIDRTVPAAAIKVTIAGKAKMWVIAPDAAPPFTQLNVDLFSANDLADPTRDVRPAGAASSGHIPLQSASAACSVTGCAWQVPTVALTGASMGLMAAVTDARTTGAVWQPTYSLVINPNQVQDNIVLGSPIAASAPGYVLAAASLGRLATALNIPQADLLARGVCLGLLWSERGEGSGISPGVSGAKVMVGEASGAAPTLFYVNDAISAIAAAGVTNQDGLFVLVGAPVGSAKAPTSYAVPINVVPAQGLGTYLNNVAIVRPGALTVMPIIPRR